MASCFYFIQSSPFTQQEQQDEEILPNVFPQKNRENRNESHLDLLQSAFQSTLFFSAIPELHEK